MRYFVKLSAILLLLAVSSGAHAVETKGRGSEPKLAEKIEAILSEPGLKGGFQGIIVQSLDDGSVWYERNADLLFMPASNQKILTSAAALDALGPDWRYETIVVRSGIVDDDGTLHGNLVLMGSGDPLLSATDVDALVPQIKAAGIRKVQGRLIADDSRFDRKLYGRGWAWDYLSSYYAAPVSALNLNENVLSLTIEPGRKPGDLVRVTAPTTDHYGKIEIRARTAEKGTQPALTVTRELGTNRIVVDGTLPIDSRTESRKPAEVTVDNPTAYALACLADRLLRAGVEITGGTATGSAPKQGAVEVARHTSPPLSEILPKLNKPSDNLIAECLLKTLGTVNCKEGSTAGGAAQVAKWLKTLGVEPTGVSIADGSGLSRYNLVSPRTLATVLKAMTTHSHGALWIDSLPVAGVDGTLRTRMKGTAAEKNCRAKTGTMSNASSLSGYVTTRGARRLLFVILMNNHTTESDAPRGVQDRIVTLLAEWESGR